MAISEDTANQPVAVHSTTQTATTAAFSPQSGTLLVALLACDGVGTGAVAPTISDSVSGSWTQLKIQNTNVSGSLGGAAVVWCRYLSSAPGSMTVTAAWNVTNGANAGNLVVRSLLGASSTQNGATAGSGGASIAPTATLTPTVIGSWIYGAILDYAANTTLTANANTSMIDTFGDATNGDTWATLKGAVATSALSSTAYGCTNANSAFNIAIAEILPASSVAVQGARVSSANHPGMAPVRGGQRFSRSAQSTQSGAVFAQAGVAQGYGYAYGLTDHSAGLLLALAGGQSGGILVNPAPAQADGTGTAFDATVSTSSSAVSGFAGAAVGTGTAFDASVDEGVIPTAGGGTGAAGDAQGAVSGQPAQADGTGTALTAGTDLAGTATTGTGSGTAGDPQAAVSGLPTESAGTGTGQDANASLGPVPGVADGTGAAPAPTTDAAIPAGVADGPGTAFAPAPDAAVPAGNAAGTGTAFVTSVDMTALPPEAAGTGTSLGASEDVTVLSDWAAGTGTAYDAIGQTSGQANAPAEVAAGTGASYDAAPAVQASAGVATGTGTAFDVGTVVSTAAGVATGAGSAPDAAGDLAAPAGSAAGTGAANLAGGAVSALPPEASGAGTAYDPAMPPPVQSGTPTVIWGSEGPSVVQGRESAQVVSGRETGVISGRQPVSSRSGVEGSTSISGRES